MQAFFNFQTDLHNSREKITALESHTKNPKKFMQKLNLDILDLASSSNRLALRAPQSSLISFVDLQTLNWEIFVLGQNYKILSSEFNGQVIQDLTPDLKSEMKVLIKAKIQIDLESVKINARAMMDYTDIGIRWVDGFCTEYKFALFGEMTFGLHYYGFL